MVSERSAECSVSSCSDTVLASATSGAVSLGPAGGRGCLMGVRGQRVLVVARELKRHAQTRTAMHICSSLMSTNGRCTGDYSHLRCLRTSGFGTMAPLLLAMRTLVPSSKNPHLTRVGTCMRPCSVPMHRPLAPASCACSSSPSAVGKTKRLECKRKHGGGTRAGV